MLGSSYTYLLLDLFSISIPLIFSFEPRIRFFGQWKLWVPAILLPAVPFIIWDVLFTKWAIWGFNPDYLTGINLINLPLEEWMFFICIPYACLFTYESLNYLLSPWLSKNSTNTITIVLIVGLLTVALFNLEKAYTATTFITLSLYLFIVHLLLKRGFLSKFYQSYLFILIPFFLVNGILTGSFIPDEVVWYNDGENLGIRMFTIPVEDTFYGMLLILLNVSIYEHLKKRKS